MQGREPVNEALSPQSKTLMSGRLMGPFLSQIICHSDGSLSTEVYRKITHTGKWGYHTHSYSYECGTAHMVLAFLGWRIVQMSNWGVIGSGQVRGLCDLPMFQPSHLENWCTGKQCQKTTKFHLGIYNSANWVKFFICDKVLPTKGELRMWDVSTVGSLGSHE